MARLQTDGVASKVAGAASGDEESSEYHLWELF